MVNFISSMNSILFQLLTVSMVSQNLAQAHTIPEVANPNQENLITSLSLPELVHLQNIDELKSNWEIKGSTIFDEGRLILTPKPEISSNTKPVLQYGSIWSRQQPPQLNSFSYDTSFRSIGAYGQTGAGISFWILDPTSFDSTDKENSGGPKKFKGLQIAFDANNRQLGPMVEVFLNDGTKEISSSSIEDSIGAYGWEYQSSNVPTTLKVGYEQGLLKVTLDNILALETDKIDLSSLIGGGATFVVGVTTVAPKDVIKTEQFELLTFNSYDTLIEDLKTESKQTLVAKHSAPKKISSHGPSRNFFEDTENRLREQLLNKDSSSQNQGQNQQAYGGYDSSSNSINDATIQEIIKRLDTLQNQGSDGSTTQIQKQLFTINKSLKNYAVRLGELQDKLQQTQNQLLDQMKQFNTKFDAIQDIAQSQHQFAENFNYRFSALNKFLDSQSQQSVNLDTKLSNLQEQYLLSSQMSGETDKFQTEFQKNLSTLAHAVKMVMVPVLILLVVLALLVYKLRSDIKHSKVL
ncbi:unnamed protein product [Ambrosiozyma monospora]|uniref:Unnamed protein product n=1 Tax=Ambrosiozyma monospora TaxID=43982 RepID=A0ACB5SSI6_AMBMO|nr:unnamed protein product [Ambrosiozyma monospora]